MERKSVNREAWETGREKGAATPEETEKALENRQGESLRLPPCSQTTPLCSTVTLIAE